MTRYRIIANPASRRGAAAQMIPVIESELKEHQLDFDLVQTERPWHAADLAFQAAQEGVEVAVAAGGAWAAGSGRLRKALGTTACLIYASPARSVSCK